MRKTSIILFALALILSSTRHAQQYQDKPSSERTPSAVVDKNRIALIIGNKKYSPGELKNSVNDANDMAKALKELGFEVTLGINIRTKEEMIKLINGWSTTIPANGVALFYYAGHGVQVDGNNYLIPVSAKITNGEEVKQQGVDLEYILGVMTAPDNHLNIIIIDACRNTLRSYPRGLSGLAPVVGSRGTYIAYSTAPGSFASDGASQNGLFTEHLLKHIKTPRLNIEDLFKLVRRDVTNDKNNGVGQLPWDASSMLVDFYFDPESNKHPIEPKPEIPSPDAPTIRITVVPAYDPMGGGEPLAKIEGKISGLGSGNFRVVLYSWTDKWYIQPTQANPFTKIEQDGRWSAFIHGGTKYAALLVRPDFKPQYITFKLPNIGGEVVAVTTVEGQRQ